MTEERRIRLRDGISLRVHLRGEGAPVLLVHGFTGSVEAWGEAVLGGLARHRRVVAVDLPGHGESDDPGDPERYRMEEVVRDLGEVLDAVGAPRAAWVGYSMGGRVALGAAVRSPGRIDRLVLESASPGLRTPEERAERRRSDEALARRIEEEGIEAFVDRWMALPLFATQRRLPDEVLSRARELRLRNRPGALAGCLRGLGTGRQPSHWERLGGVEAPTLLLAGEEDRKFRRIGREMEERLPDARRETVAGAGHTVHLERPEAWLRAVTGFLGAG